MVSNSEFIQQRETGCLKIAENNTHWFWCLVSDDGEALKIVPPLGFLFWAYNREHPAVVQAMGFGLAMSTVRTSGSAQDIPSRRVYQYVCSAI